MFFWPKLTELIVLSNARFRKFFERPCLRAIGKQRPAAAVTPAMLSTEEPVSRYCDSTGPICAADLPDDILEEIASWLDFRSLLCFRRVARALKVSATGWARRHPALVYEIVHEFGPANSDPFEAPPARCLPLLSELSFVTLSGTTAPDFARPAVRWLLANATVCADNWDSRRARQNAIAADGARSPVHITSWAIIARIEPLAALHRKNPGQIQGLVDTAIAARALCVLHDMVSELHTFLPDCAATRDFDSVLPALSALSARSLTQPARSALSARSLTLPAPSALSLTLPALSARSALSALSALSLTLPARPDQEAELCPKKATRELMQTLSIVLDNARALAATAIKCLGD